MANDVKWIKLTVGMFDNRKIRHLRKLPEGNNIVLIWVMLLTMAGRCNSNGFIFLTENIPYTTKMLADELEFNESVIQIALNALEKFGMICRDGELLSIPGWEEHQSADELERIREKNRKRVSDYRERQKQKAKELSCNIAETLQDTLHETLQSRSVTVQKENKNIDKEKELNKTPLLSPSRGGSKKTKRFVPPTVEEVKEYCTQRNNGIDAETFVSFYESKGWMVGKNKMVSWKSAIVTWERKRGFKQNPEPEQETPKSEPEVEEEPIDYMKMWENYDWGNQQ